MKLFGHPVHQQLVVFPLGLLTTAAIFDLIALVRANSFWSGISFWLITAGVIGGFLAAVFGTMDWLGLPTKTRAKRIGLWHGCGNALVMLLFTGSWLLRHGEPENPSAFALTLSFVAVAVALVSGWLGGELVDRMGVGVDEGANLNAPSSLSGKPAGHRSPRPAKRAA
jgi:uncharacterized membrane protein